MTRLTTEELKETIRLADAATPGPYIAGVGGLFLDEEYFHSLEASAENLAHIANNNPARAKSMALEILRLREELKTARDGALEEAAQLVDYRDFPRTAEMVRALKGGRP